MAKNFTHTLNAGGGKSTLVVSGTAAEISQGVNEIVNGILLTYLPPGTQTTPGTFTFLQDSRTQGHVNKWLLDGQNRPHTIV